MNAKLALFTVVLMAAPSFALANANPHAKTCKPSNVAGSFGFNGSGTILPGNDMGLPPGPVTFAGVLIFEANGQFHGTETISFNGNVTSGVRFDGTYTVNPDCTVTLVDPGFFHNFGVFVDNRNELLLLVTDNGVLNAFTAKRIRTQGREGLAEQD